MAELYLCTPRQFDPTTFGPDLARVLDAHAVACVRLALDSTQEAEIAAAAMVAREVCADHNIPVVLAEHFRMVRDLGLDGVHLEGPAHVRAARDALPKGAIVGAFCGTSRHNGLTAGEIGADYVSFGPLSASALGSGEVADPDLFRWWAQMIELPVVAEGGLTAAIIADLAETADFLCFGDEIWSADDPSRALAELLG